MRKKALITGITGQDGSYLAELVISKGDEVITKPFSFISTAEVIALLCAKPIFVDIKKDQNIDENEIESKISKKTILEKIWLLCLRMLGVL